MLAYIHGVTNPPSFNFVNTAVVEDWCYALNVRAMSGCAVYVVLSIGHDSNATPIPRPPPYYDANGQRACGVFFLWLVEV